MNFQRRFDAYYLDRDLPADAQRVDLHGRLRTAVWPPFCVNCCAPAQSRLVVERIFRRGHRHTPWRYVIRRARVPFCPLCLARNSQLVEAGRMPLGELVLRLVATPLVIPFVGGAIVARIFLPGTITQPLGTPLHNVGLAILAAMLLAMGTSAWGSWRSNRFFLVPPENEITAACALSDELGGPLTGWHRAYAFRNRDYARAFVDANRDRLWTNEDSVRVGWLNAAFVVVFVVVLLVARVLFVHS